MSVECESELPNPGDYGVQVDTVPLTGARLFEMLRRAGGPPRIA